MQMKINTTMNEVVVEWDYSGGSPPAHEKVTFTAKDSADTLSGTPSNLFNSPSPGGDLIAELPVPDPGKNKTYRLDVSSTATGGPIPIRVHLNRPS